jgi:hypothetical protein
LNDAERQWVAENVADAKQMLAGDLTVEALDDLWPTLLRENPADPNPGINMVASRSAIFLPSVSVCRGSR